MQHRKMVLVAHAGCMATPMNSLESMEKALEWNADKIEIDVRFLPDGTPVLTHNPAGPGCSCLFFEEALRFLAPRREIGMVIDLKEWSNLPELERLQRRYNMLERNLYAGNLIGDMETMRKGCAGVPYYPNGDPRMLSKAGRAELDEFARKAAEGGAAGIGLFYPAVTAQLAESLHAQGLKLSAWTVDSPDEIRRVIACGADMITTNRPDLAGRIMEEARHG